MNNFENFLEENPEYKEKYNALTDEKKQQLTEAIKTAEKAINALVLVPIVLELTKQVVELCKNIISLYPNKRVVHLALHSKKKRVRKKNMHRIIKDMQRWDNGRE